VIGWGDAVNALRQTGVPDLRDRGPRGI
jgi:hypothetical protein